MPHSIADGFEPLLMVDAAHMVAWRSLAPGTRQLFLLKDAKLTCRRHQLTIGVAPPTFALGALRHGQMHRS